MSNLELIKELRALTAAGMKTCKEALEESNWDLQKAIDVVKVKGLNLVSGSNKVASEGKVAIKDMVMVECNSNTDFVSNSHEFQKLTEMAASSLFYRAIERRSNPDVLLGVDYTVMEACQNLSASTKENISVRRYWVMDENKEGESKVFSYVHSNGKIGVLLHLRGSNPALTESLEFKALGEDLTMQIAAMSPLAVSKEDLKLEDVERQRKIFETQLIELKKPEASWSKIIDGKFNKYYSDVCLVNQESILSPKTTVQSYLDKVGEKYNGKVTVVNFVLCKVGEGLEQPTEQLAEEVAKLMK